MLDFVRTIIGNITTGLKPLEEALNIGRSPVAVAVMLETFIQSMLAEAVLNESRLTGFPARGEIVIAKDTTMEFECAVCGWLGRELDRACPHCGPTKTARGFHEDRT